MRQDAETTLKGAASVFDGLGAAWNGKATQSLPHRADLFRTAYSYYGVGQRTAFGGIEGVREGNIFFCGEHTSQAFQGFMEGGASEGVRVAREIAGPRHGLAKK